MNTHLQDNKTKTTEKAKVTIEPKLLEDALFHVQEMMERAQIPFMVFGNTAKHIYKGEGLEGDVDVNVGVKKSELTDSQFKTLKQLIPELDISELQLSYYHNEVPIIIDVIHAEYNVFKYPDRKFFTFEWFNLPNPFADYWQKKDFIK